MEAEIDNIICFKNLKLKFQRECMKFEEGNRKRSYNYLYFFFNLAM